MDIEVVNDDVKRVIREGGDDAVHEAKEVDPAAPLGMHRDDLAGGDLERGEQGRGAVAACSRGSARSRRARSVASNSLAPRPGLKAFRRHRAQ